MKHDKSKKNQRDGFLFDEGAGDSVPEIDLFADEESPSAKQVAAPVEAADELQQDEAQPLEDASESAQFTFDRYGHRVGGKKVRYGKRKDAPKATTTVVEHETAAKREYDAAKARADARAAVRRREEDKQASVQRAQRQKRRRTSMTTIVLGVAAAAVLLFMAWFVTRIGTISVVFVPDGYTENEIVQMSKLELGKSILFQNLPDAEARIEQDAFLDVTSMKYVFPSTIQIQVSKRSAAACIRWGWDKNYIAIIDENGVVLDAQAETAGDLLIVEGLDVSNLVEGQRIGDATDSAVAVLIDILNAMNDHDLLDASRSPRLSSIDLSELMNVRIYTSPSNYCITVGDTTELQTKFTRLDSKWDKIMARAAQYVNSGYTTITVYLYGKEGVIVSPLEAGSVYSTEPIDDYTLPTDSPTVTTDPNATIDPNATPNPTTPTVTTPPPTDEPFTG